jgi:PAS domain S-box-containing protein
MSDAPDQVLEHAGATLAGDLQAWEEGFRIAIDTIPGLAWFGSAEGPVEFLNRQWCDYTGISMDQALGWGWTVTIHPDDMAALEAQWRSALAQGAAGELEARVRRSDGEYHWFLFRYAPLLDGSGRVLKWYGTNIDIEERKRAEAALLASEQLIRGQVNALKGTLDALATESDPHELVAHSLRTLTTQFGAHSASVWRRGASDDDAVGIAFVFEDGAIVPITDPRFAGLDLTLPMEDIWPWPEVFRSGKPSLIEDIRRVPPFPLRDRLLPLGIVTVLLLPLLVAGRLEGAIGLRFRRRRVFQADQVELAQALANQAMLMIRLAELSAQGRVAAVAGERNRIARDIHDTLAQGFTGIIVQLEAAEDASRRGLGDEAGQHLVKARQLARESLSEARRSVQALRPRPLEAGGVVHALRALFGKLADGPLRSEFRVLGEPGAMSPEWEENLFRIAQECLTNVLRHAAASRVEASIGFGPHDIRFECSDDGCGFDPAAGSEGYGLLGMRERVVAMGGHIDVDSAPGRGTRVSIRLPSYAFPAAEIG